MTQTANLLAIVTIFIGLWTLIPTFDSQRKEGLICETKIPMQEFELKVQGAYARGGDVIAGFYG